MHKEVKINNAQVPKEYKTVAVSGNLSGYLHTTFIFRLKGEILEMRCRTREKTTHSDHVYYSATNLSAIILLPKMHFAQNLKGGNDLQGTGCRAVS